MGWLGSFAGSSFADWLIRMDSDLEVVRVGWLRVDCEEERKEEGRGIGVYLYPVPTSRYWVIVFLSQCEIVVTMTWSIHYFILT